MLVHLSTEVPASRQEAPIHLYMYLSIAKSLRLHVCRFSQCVLGNHVSRMYLFDITPSESIKVAMRMAQTSGVN